MADEPDGPQGRVVDLAKERQRRRLPPSRIRVQAGFSPKDFESDITAQMQAARKAIMYVIAEIEDLRRDTRELKNDYQLIISRLRAVIRKEASSDNTPSVDQLHSNPDN